jgi:hypothetical protein
MEEDAMHVLVHLFESDLLIAQNLANENAAFVPTAVAAVIHSHLATPPILWESAEAPRARPA